MIVLVGALLVWGGALAYVIWSVRADRRLLRHLERLDREQRR